MIHHYLTESEILNLNYLHIAKKCGSCIGFNTLTGRCIKFNRITDAIFIEC